MDQHAYIITTPRRYACPKCERPESIAKGSLCLACCATIAKDINRNAKPKPRYTRA